MFEFFLGWALGSACNDDTCYRGSPKTFTADIIKFLENNENKKPIRPRRDCRVLPRLDLEYPQEDETTIP